MGVIAMKAVVRGALVERGLAPQRLLSYVLSYPVATVIVGITDIAHLEENVRIARAFEPMTKEEMAATRAWDQRRPGSPWPQRRRTSPAR